WKADTPNPRAVCVCSAADHSSPASEGSTGGKSSRGGTRVASPLIKPDVRVSRIRLIRKLSVTGMHSQSAPGRSQEAQPEGLQMGIERLSRRKAVTALAATIQVATQAATDEPVQLAERLARVAVAEVVRPRMQPAVQASHQFREWHETTSTVRLAPQPVPSPCQRLRRSRRIQVAMGTTLQVAIIPEREPQEVQALAGMVQLDHPCLLPVDRQPEAAF